MRTTYRANGIIFITSVFFMVFSSQLNAACSRDDVAFYLGKGFTPGQITSLCTTSGAPAGAVSQSDQQAAAIEGEKALFLKRAIKAHKISLTQDVLQYTRKFCIEYGEENLAGFTPEVCPDVRFIITLKGLEILRMGKRYHFYGQPEILVKNNIAREIIGELQDQKPENQTLILENFEKGDKTAIPVRDDFSLEEVAQVLKQLSHRELE